MGESGEGTVGAPGAANQPARLIMMIGALTAFGPLSIDTYLPALPALSRALAGPPWELQLTLTACLLGLAVGQMVAGPLSDVLGRRGPLLAGLGLYAAASGACALAPSVPALIALRLLQGASGGASIVIARAAARDLYGGPALARFLALTMVVNGLAPILAPIAGAQILHMASWRGVFVVLAVVGAALLAVAARGLPETLAAARRHPGGLRRTLGTFRGLARERPFVGCGLALGLAYAAMFTYIGSSSFVLQDRYGISPQVFSLIFAANALGIMGAGQVSALLVRRTGARVLLAGGLALSAGGALLLLGAVATGGGLGGILPGFFLVVASIGFIAPNATALALAGHAREAGSASALLGLAQFVLGGAAAPLGGIAGPRAELPMAATIAVASLGAAMVFALLARRGDR